MSDNAKEYAVAIFAIALENDNIQTLYTDLSVVAQILDENLAYLDYLINPSISKDERMENLHSVFNEFVSDDAMAFLSIMVEHNDVYSILPAISEFLILYNDYIKCSSAVVTSAVELTDEQKRHLVDKLNKKLNKQIHATYVVDETLIGGMTISVDGKFYDGSVKKNLDNIKEVIS